MSGENKEKFVSDEGVLSFFEDFDLTFVHS